MKIQIVDNLTTLIKIARIHTHPKLTFEYQKHVTVVLVSDNCILLTGKTANTIYISTCHECFTANPSITLRSRVSVTDTRA